MVDKIHLNCKGKCSLLYSLLSVIAASNDVCPSLGVSKDLPEIKKERDARNVAKE